MSKKYLYMSVFSFQTSVSAEYFRMFHRIQFHCVKCVFLSKTQSLQRNSLLAMCTSKVQFVCTVFPSFQQHNSVFHFLLNPSSSHLLWSYHNLLSAQFQQVQRVQHIFCVAIFSSFVKQNLTQCTMKAINGLCR